MDAVETAFEQSLNSNPIGDVFDAVMKTKMIPAPEGTPGVPNAELGKAAYDVGIGTFQGPAQAIAQTLQAPANELGIGEQPLTGIGPALGAGTPMLRSPTVSEGADIIGQAGAAVLPQAIESLPWLGDIKVGTRTLPAEAPRLPRPYDAETSIVKETPESAFESAVPKTPEEAFDGVLRPEKMVAPTMDTEGIPSRKFIEPDAIKGELAKTEADVLKPDPISKIQAVQVGVQKGLPAKGIPDIRLFNVKGDPEAIKEVFGTNDLASVPENVLREKGITIPTPVIESGSYFRGGGEGAMPAGTTAKDILNYEKETLGNSDIKINIPENELNKIPSTRLQWVTTTKKAAKNYGDTTSYSVGKHRIIAEDSEDGKLIEILPMPGEVPNPEAGNITLPGPEQAKQALNFLTQKLDTTGQYDVIDDLKAGRRGYKNEADFKDALVTEKALENLSPLEDEALKFMQTRVAPKPYKANPSKAALVSLIEHPTPAMERAWEEIRPWLDKSHTELKNLNPEIGYVQDYFPDMWKQDKNVEMHGGFTTRAGSMNERVFDSMTEGINQGLEPKYTSARDMLKAYASAKNNAVYNTVFRNALKGIEDKDIIRLNKDAPANWKHIPNVAFAGYKVNPQYYDKLKFLKGTPESNIIGKSYDYASALMKKSLFFGGGFHGVTMGETALEVLGSKAMGIPKALLDSVKSGGAALVDPEFTARMLRANLNLVAPSDIDMGRFDKLFKDIDGVLKTNLSNYPGIKHLIQSEKGLDRALWTHEQATLKLFTARVLCEWEDATFPDKPARFRDREVADTVNFLYGSLSWDLLFDDPQWQKYLTRMFMAPDYWISTLGTFAKNFTGGVGGKAARAFTLRGWMYMVGGAAIANYCLTKKILGKGEFPWQSEDERGIAHMLLWKVKSGRYKGRRIYVNFGKSFMEPYRLMAHPIKVAIGKANPMASLLHDVITGKSLTGYDLQLERPGATAGRVAGAFNPIWNAGSSLAGTFPLTMGFSYPKLEDGLKSAIWKEEIAKRERDKDALKSAIEERQHIIDEARMNGLKYGYVEKQVRSKIKAQIRSEGRYGNEGLQGAIFREATGFRLSDIVGRQLQSIRDKLRNANQ